MVYSTNSNTESATEIYSTGKCYRMTVFIVKQRRTFVYNMKVYNPDIDNIVTEILKYYCETGHIKFKNNIDLSLGRKYVKEAIDNELKTSKFSDGILMSLKR